MITTHKIKLDFNLQETIPRIRAVQGDQYSRMVEVSMHSNTVPWMIPEHTTVLIRYRKPNRTIGVYDTLPNGESAFHLEENIITMTIAPDLLTTAGDVSMIISLICGEQVLSTFEMVLEVQANHNTGNRVTGAGGYISGLLPSPKNAQEGQILAVDKIGANGTILALSAIDLPPCNSIQSISQDTEAATESETVYNVDLSDGTQHSFTVKNGADGENGRSAYDYAQDAGYTGTEAEFAMKLAKGYPNTSVTEYGAKGDGVTNDTKAFQDALAENRVVFVPGGTYVLNGTLVIRENCGLELSQDTILKFTQTSGNCIEMRGSAVLRGNHAIISAAFGMTGNVISMDTSLDGEPHNSIPPYEKSCPQWKRQRFVYDVNIIKPNAHGFNRPLDDGKCNGTAIYVHGDGANTITFLWGVVMSGIRIAGGFSYGIRAVNTNNGWNHDMRIEAVIEACEVGVSLENCNGAHLNVTVQPNTSNPGGTKYEKQGICLKNSKYVDMMRSRVWDWQHAVAGAENQHIALYGECSGLLLDDFLVHEHPGTDIRDEIYTDNLSNFDTMTILQEPANKWFKSVNNIPYFNDGSANRKMMLETDKITAKQAEFILDADGYYVYDPKFENLVPKGINSSGASAPYTDGHNFHNSAVVSAKSGYTTTGFIPVPKGAKTIRIAGEGINFALSNNENRIAFFDASFTMLGTMAYYAGALGGGEYWGTVIDEDSTSLTWQTNDIMPPSNDSVYMRVCVKGSGANLIVTVNEEIAYDATWIGEPRRLDDSIKVKAENVVGLESGTSIDVTTEVGQTIIVKAVDENGKPIEWEAADYHPRTHWSEVKEILPETTVEIDPDAGVGIIFRDFTLEVGKEYTITYNGVPHVISNGIMLGDIFAIGNLGVVDSEIAITEEPFCLAYSPLGEDENGDPIYSWAIVPVDGSTTVTLSIVGEVVTKIPEKYVSLPAQYCAIEVYAGSNTTVNIEMDTTKLVDAILNYSPVYVNLSRCAETDPEGSTRSVEWLPACASYGSITASETITIYSVGEHLFKCVAGGMDKRNLPIDLSVLSTSDGTVQPIFIHINGGTTSV